MTSKKVFKIFLFWQFDKEENWLNNMSAQGWQLKKVKGCGYYFSKGKPNQYTYRLQYIYDNKQNIKAYMDILEDAGIKVIGKTNNFFYLAKKGNFEIFSDNESKIEYLKKFGLINIGLLTINLLLIIPSLKNFSSRGTFAKSFISLSFLLFIVNLTLFIITKIKINKIIRSMNEEF